MKETYFQENTIGSLTDQWIELYGRPNKAIRQPFILEKAALLILDMQKYFLAQESHAFVPSGQAIIPGLNRMGKYFRDAGRPVIATQHINTPENARMMGRWWSELILPEHNLAGLDPDLGVEKKEILQKSQYDAFYDSDLSSRLVKQNVTQVVISGVMTHLCCETTARSAFMRGYEVFFLVDGTATYNKDFHQAALKNLAHGVAVLSTVDQLIGE